MAAELRHSSRAAEEAAHENCESLKPPPLLCAVCPCQLRLPWASSMASGTSRDGAPTASMGSNARTSPLSEQILSLGGELPIDKSGVQLVVLPPLGFAVVAQL